MVITKDFSRLGRDYIMTDYYTKVFFPSKKIRYIAINDCIDWGETGLCAFTGESFDILPDAINVTMRKTINHEVTL